MKASYPNRNITRAAHKPRGFTLAELAIVMGVVGIIFGAIWTGAAAVNSNSHISQTVDDFQQIAANMRQTYMGTQTLPATPSLSAMIAANLFTPDLVGSSATTVSPWQSPNLQTPVTIYFLGNAFRVSFYGTSPKVCFGILSKLANLGTQDGPYNTITACSVSTSIPTAGLSENTINAICGQNRSGGCQSTELDYKLH